MEKRVLEVISKYVKSNNIILQKPKKAEYGHFATPVAFSLAKELRKAPKMIAEDLAKEFEKEDIFAKVEAINGFLNFKLDDSFLNEYASWMIQNPDSFGKDEKDETILLEFVSANPTGPLHIGHARGAVIGDSLLRIGRHLGYKITSEYYVNDAGNQIYLLGLSLYLAGCEHILKTDVTYPDEYYRGEYIVDLAKEASEALGSDIFSDKANIEKLSIFGKEKMLELIKANLAQANIYFDNFVSEKALYDKWSEIQSSLEKNSALYEKNKKIWLKSSEHKDEKDRVVVRDTGEPTYLAGDIIYHDDKFKRGFDKYINIWGSDHHGYLTRVKSSIKYLGYDDSKLEVLFTQMVALLKDGEPFKMSKRAGNFILMSDVVEEVGAESVRFVFLSKRCDTHLEFDLEDLNRQDSSNPIFYVNYAHARIHSIFTKLDKKFDDVVDVEFKDLDDKAKDLLFLALRLPKILQDSFEQRAVNKVTEYVYELSSAFHSFYNSNRVIDSDKQDEYLKLFASVATSIKVALSLLGINAKERM